jgi:hypothetical protein
LAILGQKSLDQFKKYNLGLKTNIYHTPHFCLKRTKGKTEYENHSHKILPIDASTGQGKQSIENSQTKSVLKSKTIGK